MIKSICVFCGSSPGKGTEYLVSAQRFAKELALRGISLVYGGGNIGIMGELAESALKYNVKVTGVIPGILVEREAALKDVDELIIVNSMHERKAKMSELSDAFVALPGGIGTLEELFEVWTWKQLGIHSKPVGVLNTNGYYDSLLAFLNDVYEKGFMKKEVLDMLAVETDSSKLIDRLSEISIESGQSPSNYNLT